MLKHNYMKTFWGVPCFGIIFLIYLVFIYMYAIRYNFKYFWQKTGNKSNGSTYMT